MRDGGAALARAASEDDALAVLLPEIARFLAREVNGDAIDREGCIPQSVREGAARLGLFGLTVPEEFGGAGLSLASTCRVVSEIAKVDRSVAIMIGLHAGLGTRGLVEHGSVDARRRWLPALASGEAIASFAATEAAAGSDLTAIRSIGRAEGDALRIDGEKSYVTNGGFAGLFTALIRTPGLGGARAHSLVCVPADAAGVELGREERKLGIRGSSTVTVRFDDVRIPRSNVIGAEGGGMAITHTLLTWGRTLMSSGCVGTARAALSAAIEHVKRRRQFGRPIGELGATRAHVAWMAARLHAMDTFVRHVGALHARGDSIEIDSAIAKIFTSDSAFEICDRALQLHGALGFIESTGVARMMRDCRITRIFEGANDVLLVRLGAARIATRAGARSTVPHVVQAASDGDVQALARRFDAAVEDVRARIGLAAVRRQLVLQRIAAAEIALRVSRVVAASPGFGDDVVARAAVVSLVEEGERALDGLARADRDEAIASAVCERIYEV